MTQRYEYTLEVLQFKDARQRDERLLALLNERGRDGWRLASLHVEPRIAYNETSLRVLLERQTPEGAPI